MGFCPSVVASAVSRSVLMPGPPNVVMVVLMVYTCLYHPFMVKLRVMDPNASTTFNHMLYPLVNVYIAMERSTMLFMGKSTISMAIFNCYVSSPEGSNGE